MALHVEMGPTVPLDVLHFPSTALKALLPSSSLSSTKRYILVKKKKTAICISLISLQTLEKHVALINFFVVSPNTTISFLLKVLISKANVGI